MSAILADKRIVMVLPARLGDALFCTPAIRLIKRHAPGASIEVITLSALSAEVVRNNLDISAVHVLPDGRETARLAERFARERCLGVNIHDGPLARQYFERLGLEAVTIPPRRADRHQALQAAEFVAGLLGVPVGEDDVRYVLLPQEDDRRRVRERLAHEGWREGERLIGCHLGCHGLAKRGLRFWRKLEHRKMWPMEQYLRLAEKVGRDCPGTRFVLTGSRGEKALGRRFRRASRGAIDLIGQTSVAELAALMGFLRVLLTPDTGALHVACATEVPLVALFGPTSPAVTGPYPPAAHRVVLRGASLAEITVEDVFAAVTAFLGK